MWEETTETPGALKDPRTNRSLNWEGRSGCRDLGTEKAVKEAGTFSGESQLAETEPGDAGWARFSSRRLISCPGFPGQAQRGVRSQVKRRLLCIQEAPGAGEIGGRWRADEQDTGGPQHSPEDGDNMVPALWQLQNQTSESEPRLQHCPAGWLGQMINFKEPDLLICGIATLPEDCKDETSYNFSCTPRSLNTSETLITS